MLCRVREANPPIEEWLIENFNAHESESDEIATIALSVPVDDRVVYPGYIYGDAIEAFLYWQGDKSKRLFPRKELNKHWHIEYQQ